MAEKMTIVKQKVTPDVATELLKTNLERNRPISVDRVAMYEHDMLSGKWVDNGETIKIDSQGRLIDGQHRLKAIERSGVSLWLWIARGVSSDAFESIDTGLKRTPRQLFGMSNDPLKRQNTASAIAAFSFRVFAGVHKATQSQMGEFIESNRSLLEWLYGSIRNSNHASAFYLVTAIAMHLHDVSDAEINGFLEGAIKGVFDPKKDTVAFRHCVQVENMRKTKLRSFTLTNLHEIERCAYSYVNTMQRLTAKEDPYPVTMDTKYKIIKA